MIRDLVFNPELAEPSVGQVNPDLSAEPPFRSKREYVADDQHPDHQHWINRRPASVRIERRQLFVHPTQVEQAIDLPYQMIRRHHLVEIKRIKELPLAALLPSQHASLPQMPVSNRTESRATIRLNMSFATQLLRKRTSDLWGHGLIGPEVGGAYHLAPFLGFVGDIPREIRRRTA